MRDKSALRIDDSEIYSDSYVPKPSKRMIASRFKRCLLANDNPFLLEAFKQALSKHFDLVETVENGQEAVNAVTNQPVDHFQAIVLDISMPIMDGMQACILIKEYLSRACVASRKKDKKDINLANSMNIDSDQDSNSSEPATVPFVYALTSESDMQTIAKIKAAGFKEICKFVWSIANKFVCFEQSTKWTR